LSTTTSTSSKRLFFSHNLTTLFSPLDYKGEKYHSRTTTCQTQGLNKESISGFSIAGYRTLNPPQTQKFKPEGFLKETDIVREVSGHHNLSENRTTAHPSHAPSKAQMYLVGISQPCQKQQYQTQHLLPLTLLNKIPALCKAIFLLSQSLVRGFWQMGLFILWYLGKIFYGQQKA
jgi:hypothetical protein